MKQERPHDESRATGYSANDLPELATECVCVGVGQAPLSVGFWNNAKGTVTLH